MKSHAVFAAVLALTGAVPSQATIINDTTTFAGFTLSYDDATSFTGLDFSSGGGGGLATFGWDVATTVQTTNVNASFALPSFTITAKPGWALSGPVSASLGNLSFVEFGAAASTSATATGSVQVDGGPALPIGGSLTRTVLNASPFTYGYYAGGTSLPAASFTSFGFSAGLLSLGASGNGLTSNAAVFAQGQNTLEYSLTATPVPEPETAALMLAGLLTLGSLARRRGRG